MLASVVLDRRQKRWINIKVMLVSVVRVWVLVVVIVDVMVGLWRGER